MPRFHLVKEQMADKELGTAKADNLERRKIGLKVEAVTEYV